MATLLDELVEIYSRFDDIEREPDEGWAANEEALDNLAEAIIKIAKPQNVGDVMMLRAYALRSEGLAYLIKKDASDEYDQVEGFVDWVFCEDIEGAITPSQHGFNGLQLCQWINQEFP